jgi:hypothetical protein
MMDLASNVACSNLALWAVYGAWGDERRRKAKWKHGRHSSEAVKRRRLIETFLSERRETIARLT